MRVNDRLVWIDCEMTGLDIERDALIEIACLVTDAELTLFDEGVDVIIKPPAEALASMPEVVREMHTTSGLLAELPSGITLAEAQDIVLGYVREHVAEPKKVPLCGNSIATDRWFIARDMPELDAYLHYRMVDVSSIKELARRWYPRAYFASPAQARRPPGPGRHQGERAGTAVLPGGGIRAAAGTGFGDRARDRGPVHRARRGGQRRELTRRVSRARYTCRRPRDVPRGSARSAVAAA